MKKRAMVFVGNASTPFTGAFPTLPGVLAGAFRLYICTLASGVVKGDDLLRFLGRWQWLARPASLSTFLTGVYLASAAPEHIWGLL